jgi:outer membrane scaffolding protein for murein synthesis (MipA/OmpV family)
MPLRVVPFVRQVAIVALAALAAAPAAAQTGSDPFGLFGDRWQVGGLVYVSPKFEGAKSYQVTGFPFIAPAGFGDNGIVQIKGADDVRFRVLQFNGLEFGPLAFSVSYHHQVTGDETGGLIRFGAEAVTRLAPSVKLTTGIGTNYATDDYMTAFFGVNAAQSVASGLPVYNPSAGFKDVYIGATAAIDLNDRWTLLLIGRYAHLIGDAADSPIVETESQFYGGAALSYKFSLGR